jgi:hypothetical protein
MKTSKSNPAQLSITRKTKAKIRRAFAKAAADGSISGTLLKQNTAHLFYEHEGWWIVLTRSAQKFCIWPGTGAGSYDGYTFTEVHPEAQVPTGTPETYVVMSDDMETMFKFTPPFPMQLDTKHPTADSYALGILHLSIYTAEEYEELFHDEIEEGEDTGYLTIDKMEERFRQ